MSRQLLRVVFRPESRRFLSSLTSFEPKPEEKTRALIDRIIRVDQAGELAADRIYAGQMAVLGRTDVGPTIQVHCFFMSQFERNIHVFSLAYVG